ncbi:MFS transporter [Micromonospora zamorensis]|uniref:MFS transporter n=1 Tax=Micromonospora zamorensis TaxID=709883 RepID=UPI0033BCF064
MASASPSPAALTAVPRRRPTTTLIRAQLVTALGDGCFYVIFVVYLVQVGHLRPAQVGGLLTVAWGAGFLLTHPLGALGDRIGLRRVTILLSAATAAALLTLASAPTPWLASSACVAYAIAQSGAGATRQALLVSLVPSTELVAVRAGIQTAVNAGIGLGATAGGLALFAGTPTVYRAALVGDAALFAVSAIMLTRLPPAARAPVRTGHGWDAPRDTRYVVVAALNAVLYLYMPMLSVLLPLYLTSRTAAPSWIVAAVFVVNTLGVLGWQRRTARRVTILSEATRAIRLAGLALCVACVLFSTATATTDPAVTTGLLLAAVAVQVAGELRLAAGSWCVGFELADPTRPGQWQGVYSSGVPLARAVGPAALTALVMVWSGPGWLVLGLVFLATGLTTTLAVTWAAHRRPFQTLDPEAT